MAGSVFVHEFMLRYEVAGTATSPQLAYVAHGRNSMIDLRVNRSHREEHILWTDDKKYTCFCNLRMTRQDVEGPTGGIILCNLSVSLIHDGLSDYPFPNAVGVPHVDDHISLRRAYGFQTEFSLRDEVDFYTGLSEERSFFLGAKDRLSQLERASRISDRSKQDIQYTGVIRPVYY